MKQVFVLLLATILFLRLSAQEQVYFNKRIDISNGGYDKGISILNVNNDYVIGAIPNDSIYHYFWQLAFVTIDTVGNKKNVKIYGDTISHHMLGNPGALIDYGNNKYFAVGNIISPGGNWVYNRGWLVCLDNNFDTLWTKTYGEQVEPYDTTYVIFQLKKKTNSNLIHTGVRLPIETPSSMWLMETDSLGNKLWERFFGDDVKYFQGHSIVQTTDGGYVIGGYKFKIGVSGAGDPLIIKTDSLGNEEWRINPGNPDVDDNKVMVAMAADGNIIAGTNYGTQSSGDNQWMVIKLMKITMEGEVLWDYNYGESGYDKFLLNTTVLKNGNIVTNGVITLFGDDDPWETSWILCVDSLGNELWYREYVLLEGQNSFNDLLHVIQTSDNGLIGCGMVMPGLPYDTGTVDIWVMKMDSLGCVEAGCDTTVDVITYFESEASGFRINPNPVRGVFTVALASETTEASILQLYDMYGTKVKEIRFPIGILSIKVNSSGWQGGVYLAVLSSKSKPVFSLKFVVK